MNKESAVNTSSIDVLPFGQGVGTEFNPQLQSRISQPFITHMCINCRRARVGKIGRAHV